MIYEHRLRVRYAETDAMGVAHHAAYLVWLEAARVEWIRHIGFPFADVEASGYHHAVREVQVQYRRPARFDQLLALRVALAGAAGPRMTFGYRLYDAAEADGAAEAGGAADPSPLAVARTEMIWVTAAGRATRLPAAHPLTPVLGELARYPDWATW
jgi:acyl-CoA thioester hydrolase